MKNCHRIHVYFLEQAPAKKRKEKKEKKREYAFSDSFLSLGLGSIQMRDLNKRDRLSFLT